MVKNLLVELGLEEMPAYVVTPSMKQLRDKMGAFLTDHRLTFEKIEMFSFRGYADKIGEAVVSGGRYDDLYKGMGTDVCAVGFAINVEQLIAASKLVKEEGKKGKSPLRIAITKGRMEEQVGKLLTKAGYEISALEDKGRKLIIPIAGGSMEIVLAKAPDVITYVEHGVCDIGIVGKDTILEYGGTYYEVLDLKLGKCRFAH